MKRGGHRPPQDSEGASDLETVERRLGSAAHAGPPDFARDVRSALGRAAQDGGDEEAAQIAHDLLADFEAPPPSY